jgi:hypothetical protein
MLAMALDKKITFPIKDVDRLVYIGIGTVAGFIGFKLLGKIAERVGTWLQIEEEVKRQVERSTSEERKRADELVAAVTKAIAAQGEKARPGVVADAVAALERVRIDSPDNRTVAMMLSWLYASKTPKNPQKAIGLLTDTLDSMKARGTEKPEDLADILYNRACYQYRLADLAQGADKERLKNLMYKDLEESVKLRPDNALDAKEETDDFANVKSEDKFRRITGTSVPQAPLAHGNAV